VDDAGQVICINCSGITIRNLTISNVPTGIYLEDTSNIVVMNNTVSFCSEGIHGLYCSACRFLNNTVTNSGAYEAGIRVVWGTNNEFKFNHLKGNYIGLDAEGTIEDNIISNSTYGVFTKKGIFTHNTVEHCFLGIESSGLMKISDNTIRDCSKGVWIYYLGNWVTHNNFFNNTLDALFTNSLLNRWHGNYWERPRITPKIIPGCFGVWYIMIPWMNIDLRPAQIPN